MKNYERYLKENEARAIYECLKNLHFRMGNYLDKANSVRSIFDAVLQTICNRKYEGRKPNSINGFILIINDVFEGAESRGRKLKNKLNKTRETLNKKVQHLLKQSDTGELAFNRLISEDEYKDCLYCVAETVCFFSGVVIPPYLLDACYRHKNVTMKKKLEMVIVLQLFDSLENIDKGMLVYDRLRKMMDMKDSYGFRDLDIKVVVYNPSLPEMPDTGQVDRTPASEALREGLDRLSEAINRWMNDATDGTDRPWFLWLCHRMDDKVDPELVKRLDTWMDAGMTSFYPVYMGDEEVQKRFLECWPQSEPIWMNPMLADNFFSTSLLLSVQRMQQKD